MQILVICFSVVCTSNDPFWETNSSSRIFIAPLSASDPTCWQTQLLLKILGNKRIRHLTSALLPHRPIAALSHPVEATLSVTELNQLPYHFLTRLAEDVTLPCCLSNPDPFLVFSLLTVKVSQFLLYWKMKTLDTIFFFV